jgi:hypothetical protein
LACAMRNTPTSSASTAHATRAQMAGKPRGKAAKRRPAKRVREEANADTEEQCPAASEGQHVAPSYTTQSSPQARPSISHLCFSTSFPRTRTLPTTSYVRFSPPPRSMATCELRSFFSVAATLGTVGFPASQAELLHAPVEVDHFKVVLVEGVWVSRSHLPTSLSARYHLVSEGGGTARAVSKRVVARGVLTINVSPSFSFAILSSSWPWSSAPAVCSSPSYALRNRWFLHP